MKNQQAIRRGAVLVLVAIAPESSAPLEPAGWVPIKLVSGACRERSGFRRDRVLHFVPQKRRLMFL
jgi:hypothetical protein